MTADTTKTPRRQPWLGRPALGIRTTWSDLAPCDGHFRGLAGHAPGRARRIGLSAAVSSLVAWRGDDVPRPMPLNPLALNRDK
jgi:hypothetical protein